MEYGCIGEKLSHSFSKRIHNILGDYDYQLVELDKDEVHRFMENADFKAINVTIPYKETVIPYLHYIDESAKLIGSVNTIVNRDGKLYGYNTDFFGMTELFKRAKIDPSGKKALILGTGGTAKTAEAVLKHLGASSVITCGRSRKDHSITYEEAYENHKNSNIIVNTTPVGMFPDLSGIPLDISGFDELTGIVDAVYNPLKTQLVCNGLERQIPSVGGLYMLVAQGIRASEIFFDTKYSPDTYEKVFATIASQSENVVLIGMPSSGKSTVGRLLAEKLGREFIDTDRLIEAEANATIPEIFEKFGEKHFRDLESKVINDVSGRFCAVIATGGGAVLRQENRRALFQNGRIYFLDRPLEYLTPTCDRPLSKDIEATKKLYRERLPIYENFADKIIKNSGTPGDASELIIKDFLQIK